MSRVLIGDDHSAEALKTSSRASAAQPSDLSMATTTSGRRCAPTPAMRRSPAVLAVSTWAGTTWRIATIGSAISVHGEVSCETINSYVSGDLGFTLQVVRGTVLLKGKAAPENVEVRVTHILRREEERWKLLHRHADNTIFRRPLAGESSISSESEIAAIARDWAIAAWNRHDLDAAATFLTPDWIGHYAGLGDARGYDAFKRVAGEFIQAFPDMRISVEDALTDGEKVCAV